MTKNSIIYSFFISKKKKEMNQEWEYRPESNFGKARKREKMDEEKNIMMEEEKGERERMKEMKSQELYGKTEKVKEKKSVS